MRTTYFRPMRLALCVLLVACHGIAFGQSANGQSAKTIQPKIMVIPKTKQGEDLKTMYDSSANMRVAIAKINEAFLKRNANLVSFDAKLKEARQNMNINKASGNSDDFKSMILQTSASDIYVEAEVNITRHTQRNANSVAVILEAYQTGTGNLLGVKEGRSRMTQTDDVGYLTAQAMDTISEGFLNLMQAKFDDIRENGQSVFVQFTLGPHAKYTFDSEMGNPAKMLSEAIDDWFQKNALKGVYNNQGVTSNMLVISDMRIPLKNPANPNANYTGQNLFTDINKFLRTLGVQAKREIGTNNKMLITLN